MTHLTAPIHAAKILLGLPAEEYRPAIATMAAYMRTWVRDNEIPADQREAAKSVLDELERRLW
jgi:hypothetical protein